MREIEFLIKLGLTNGESKVYLALLEIGESTTGEIVKRAKVSRSKIYEMLDKLAQKGLVSSVIKNKAKYYTASNPEEIRELIKLNRSLLDEQEKSFEKLVPNLISISKHKKEQQTATVFEGIAGIKTLFNLILSDLKKGESYYSIAIEPDSFSKEFLTFMENYHRKRAKKGINVLLLANPEIKKYINHNLGKEKLIQIRYSDSIIPTSLLIFKNKVATFTWGDNASAILISSSVISLRYKKFFESLWKIAKR